MTINQIDIQSKSGNYTRKQINEIKTKIKNITTNESPNVENLDLDNLNVTKVECDKYGNEWVYAKTAQGIDVVTVNGEPLNIFGEYNLKSNQYGGNQNDLKNCTKHLSGTTYTIDDEYIYNVLKKYFPDASDANYYSYLRIIENSACQYTALINSLFKEYEGREEEFYDTFGFPMYEVSSAGNIDYNYEKLIVDYYSYVESKANLQVKDIDLVPTKIEGGSAEAVSMFSDFLKQYNVSATTNSSDPLRNLTNIKNLLIYLSPLDLNQTMVDTYNDISASNSHMIISANNFNLYSVKDNKKNNLTDSNVGGHAMYVTGITDDGFLKVSSWGQEYAIDLSEIAPDIKSFCFYETVSY